MIKIFYFTFLLYMLVSSATILHSQDVLIQSDSMKLDNGSCSANGEWKLYKRNNGTGFVKLIFKGKKSGHTGTGYTRFHFVIANANMQPVFIKEQTLTMGASATKGIVRKRHEENVGIPIGMLDNIVNGTFVIWFSVSANESGILPSLNSMLDWSYKEFKDIIFNRTMEFEYQGVKIKTTKLR